MAVGPSESKNQAKPAPFRTPAPPGDTSTLSDNTTQDRPRDLHAAWSRNPSDSWSEDDRSTRIGTRPGPSDTVRGFRFPFGPNGSGRFEFVDEAGAVEQSLHLILRTATGERVMRPDYGCGIHDLLYAPNNSGTHGRLIHQVREAVERWEPRARDVEVSVRSDRRFPERVIIDLHYTCPTNGERRSLPHTLSLAPGSSVA